MAIFLKLLRSIIKKILKFLGILETTKNFINFLRISIFPNFFIKKLKLTIEREHLSYDNKKDKKYFISNTVQKKFILTKGELIQRKAIFKNLTNVFISGKFGSIYDNKFFYINNDYDFKNILLPEEMHSFVKIYENNKKLFLYEPRFIKTIKIDDAISFLSLQSYNYAHWILETLPNLLSSLSNIKKNTKILINYGLHKNHIQSLKLLLGCKFRNVFFVKKNQRILVGRLIYFSPVTYIPFHTKNNISNYDHGFANDFILSKLKNLYTKNFCKKNVKLRKIFLARKNTSRNIINYDEVANLVKSFNYDIIFCEDFDFLGQVNIFSNTTHVIAPSGASCANLLFCKSRTNVLIFFNSHPNMIFKLWKIFFKTLNISFMKCKSTNSSDFHSDYYVDCKKLRRFLIEFNS
jgi:hypothetical protein